MVREKYANDDEIHIKLQCYYKFDNFLIKLSRIGLNNYKHCHVYGVCLTYKTDFGLDDWIYWHLIRTTWDYTQYSAIADLHTLQFTVTHALGFSVFTSRILATDL
jgi:hypothetical protein